MYWTTSVICKNSENPKLLKLKLNDLCAIHNKTEKYLSRNLIQRSVRVTIWLLKCVLPLVIKIKNLFIVHRWSLLLLTRSKSSIWFHNINATIKTGIVKSTLLHKLTSVYIASKEALHSNKKTNSNTHKQTIRKRMN